MKHKYSQVSCTPCSKFIELSSSGFSHRVSLPYFTEIFNECYQDARELAAAETGLAIAGFPVETPFNSEAILNSDYLPDWSDRAV